MVHGGCSSVGCYAIGDANVDEVYAVVEAALDAGQHEVDVAAYPFEMNEQKFAALPAGRWDGFWRNLKTGADLFARNGAPPKVAACRGEYRFGDDADGEGCVPITGWA
jgi:murein L,D-transpeptidase YafK